MPVLATFQKNSLCKDICQTNQKVFVEKILNRFNLFFDYVITREDSLDRSEQITIAVKELDTQFQNVLFIGNTEEDGVHAKKVGCKFLKVEE